MKTGKTLTELATEIERQNKEKRDYIVPPSKIEAFAHDSEGSTRLELGFSVMNKKIEAVPLTTNGHVQLGQLTGIPKPYYDRMNLSAPKLLAENVNRWLGDVKDNKMLRILDDRCRAILSDRYRPLDNYDLAKNVLPMLLSAKVEVESCEITESRLYIKGYTQKVEKEIKKGDVVRAGILISNSEVGAGSLSVKPLLFRLVCSNGMIADKFAHKRYHVGQKQEANIKLSHQTLTARDKAFWLETRDTVEHALSEVTFGNIVDSLAESLELKIEDPQYAIEILKDNYNLSDGEETNVLKHLIEGKDLTSWGLANAVTRMAQDVDSYDRSTELESIGYEVAQLEWNR